MMEMRYAIVCIGNIDIDCHSWLAGVTSDRSLANELANKANLSYSHERTFNVFAIPDEDFVGETLKKHVEAGERHAEWDAANRLKQRDAAREKAAAAALKKAKKAEAAIEAKAAIEATRLIQTINNQNTS